MNDFCDITKEINQDIDAVTRSDSDADMLDDASQDMDYDHLPYLRRDELYSDLLEHYIDTNIDKTHRNITYKCAFFWIAMSIFIVLTVAPIVLLIIIACKNTRYTSDIAVVLGAVGGLISSIIIIPKIIAEHLFPTNEDSNMIDMVKNMQINDSRIRSFWKNKKTK